MDLPARILITGATGAIGSALALSYARPGCTLLLQGRDPAKLSVIATRCSALGATVQTWLLDLSDRTALAAWIRQLAQQPAPDLLILNAGMNAHVPTGALSEPWEDVEALLELNVRATLAILNGLLPLLKNHGSGQVALVSSLAGWFGLPVMPAYCASKAALKAYGEAMRSRLAPAGIHVNVIMPGFVHSAMCLRMPGAKPLLWSPERAARVIQQGLAKNEPRISFPFPLNLGVWCLAWLPARISASIVRWFGYGQ